MAIEAVLTLQAHASINLQPPVLKFVLLCLASPVGGMMEVLKKLNVALPDPCTYQLAMDEWKGLSSGVMWQTAVELIYKLNIPPEEVVDMTEKVAKANLQDTLAMMAQHAMQTGEQRLAHSTAFDLKGAPRELANAAHSRCTYDRVCFHISTEQLPCVGLTCGFSFLCLTAAAPASPAADAAPGAQAKTI